MDQLDGFSILEDADSVIIANRLRIWSTRTEAGYVVGSLTGTDDGEVFRTQDPQMICQLRNMMDLMREKSGLPPMPEVEQEPDLECPICHGLGYWEDGDGAEQNCWECRTP